MGEVVSDEELVKFAKMLDWQSWVEESDEVRESLEAIKNHIDGESDELANAERVKIVIVGDSAVGKTCLLISFATNEFPDDYVPTVFENYSTQMDYDGQPVLLQLWDTAGQEDYDRLRPLSYPGADIVMLCFCLVSTSTSEAVVEKVLTIRVQWSPEVKHYVSDVPQMLIGTKVDLRNASEADPHADSFEPISTQQGQEIAKEIGAVKYAEVSAKTTEGLQEAFREAVRIVLERRGIKPGAAKEEPAKAARPAPASTASTTETKKKEAPPKKEPKKKESKKDDKSKKGGKKKGDKKKNCKNQ